MTCRSYLICPNPQTCDDAFEWVEKRESDAEREMISKKQGSEGKKTQQVERGLEADDLNQESKGFVLPPCDLFNEARRPFVDTSPSLTEVSHILSQSKVFLDCSQVLRLPYPKSSLLPSVTRILQVKITVFHLVQQRSTFGQMIFNS